MVKYRRLSNEEIIALKDDFVKFLSAQSISAPDWEKLKQTKIDRVDELIDFFSDIVMEKVLSKIEYLEVLSENEIKLFHMKDSKAKLIGLKFNKVGLDLNKADQFEIIFKEHFAYLSNVAFAMVKDEDDSYDIVQQVFVKFWDKRHQVDIDQNIKSYLQ